MSDPSKRFRLRDMQEKALQGDPLSTVSVLSDESPSLFEAVRERVRKYVDPLAAEFQDVQVEEIERRVAAPEWYRRSAYDIGLTMRDMGYYRHGDVWRYGVKPEKRKKVERWKLPGRSDLKTLRLDQVAKLHTMVENELKRRGR